MLRSLYFDCCVISGVSVCRIKTSGDAATKKSSHAFNIGFTPKKNVGRKLLSKHGEKVIVDIRYLLAVICFL
jgi:hypothetical protein